MTSVQKLAGRLGVVEKKKEKKTLSGQTEPAWFCCEVTPRLRWSDRGIKHKAAGAVLITLLSVLLSWWQREWGMFADDDTTWNRGLARRKTLARDGPCCFFWDGDGAVQTGGCESSKQVCSWWSVLWRKKLKRHSVWHSLLPGGPPPPPPQSCSCLPCLFELD